MGMLMTSHRLSPDSHSDDPYRPRKTAEQLRKELEQLKADEKMEADRREARRPKKRRKFEGLGLDSSDDDSTDGMTIDKAKKKLAEYNEEDEGGIMTIVMRSNTAWERSPFFRLLNANTIKDSPDGAKGLRKVINRYDEDPDAGVDINEAGEAPDPPLPPIEITLKSRTATSIDVAWDVSSEMMDMLEAVRAVYGRTSILYIRYSTDYIIIRKRQRSLNLGARNLPVVNIKKVSTMKMENRCSSDT